MRNLEVLALIFNQQGLLFGFFGSLGGAVRAAALKTGWIDTVRVIFIGSATSFSLGVVSPVVLAPFIGDVIAGQRKSLGTLCAGAFLTGLIAVTYVERLLETRKGQDDVPQK